MRIATVVNFPAGAEDIDRATEDAHGALGRRAHEIDLVLPYRPCVVAISIAPPRWSPPSAMSSTRRLLKVILETGEWVEPGSHRKAQPDRH